MCNRFYNSQDENKRTVSTDMMIDLIAIENLAGEREQIVLM